MRSWMLIVALGVSSACTIERSVGGDDPQGSDGGSGTEAGESAAAGTETDGSGTGVASAGGSGEGTTGASDTERDTMPADTDPSDTMGPMDRPAACEVLPDDPVCAECRKTECCAQLHQCVAHDTCLCWWDCRHTGHENAVCAEMCQSEGGLFLELATCVESACGDCPL